MKFHYKALQENGREIEGDLEADAPAAVLVFLGQKGWRPVSVEKSSVIKSLESINVFKSTISVTDQVFLTRYFSLMLKVGADLLRVIDILAADFDKPVIKEFLLEMRATIEKGQPLYSVFARYPQQFSSAFINMVKAGEQSGNLEAVFNNLSISLERERDFRGRVSAALIYPIFIASLASAILIFLVIFALPKMAKVFDSGGLKPPLFSRVVFSVGAFLNQYLIIFFIIGVVLVVGGWYFFRKTYRGQQLLGRIIAALPVVNQIYKKVTMQQFAATLSSLMKAGLPIMDALHITADVASFPGVREAIRRIADQGVARGETLGVAFRREPVFPAVVTNLIAISEKAGHLDQVLATLALFFESEVDLSLKKLLSYVEPITLMVIGAMVGIIALAIILPIYQLTAQL